MTNRTVKIPSPDHPISIKRTVGRVQVKVAGHIIADSINALSLAEANYPVVQYIPIKDVDMAQLQSSAHATYCPYKGECSYYSIAVGGARTVDAVWTYAQPYQAVAEIKDHVAFYSDRVDSIVIEPV